MNTTQQRLINQVQIINNFAHIRLKTMVFLLEPYDPSLLDEAKKQINLLTDHIDDMVKHLLNKGSLTSAEKQLRSRSVTIFSRKIGEQLNLFHLSLHLLEESLDGVSFEPWERGIAAQMLRHIETLISTQHTLLDELLEYAHQQKDAASDIS